jgi:hypothetical protein
MSNGTANKVVANLTNSKWWQVCAMMLCLIGVLLAGGWAASNGVQVSMSIELQAQVADLQEQVNKTQLELNLTRGLLEYQVNSSVSGLIRENDYTLSQLNTYTCAQRGNDSTLEYYNTNASEVEQYAVNKTLNGGLIFFRNGTYLPLILNKSVSLVGEGVYAQTPARPLDPDDTPTSLSGVVISVTTPNTNGITITTTCSGITIENIGIVFSGAGTGHGIYSNAGYDIDGLMYSTLKTIMVKGHDVDHYAIYAINPQHTDFLNVFSWGGLAYKLEANGTKNYGNGKIIEMYGRGTLSNTKPLVTFVGTAGLFNLMSIDRLQTIGGGTGFHLELINTGKCTFRDTDIETTYSNAINMTDCNDNVFEGGLLDASVSPGLVLLTGCNTNGFKNIPCGGFNFTSTGSTYNNFVERVSGNIIGKGVEQGPYYSAIAGAINGTWVPYSLCQPPTEVLLTIHDNVYFNSTCYAMNPFIYIGATTSTHYQIGFYAWNANTGTIVPITAAYAKNVDGMAMYKP